MTTRAALLVVLATTSLTSALVRAESPELPNEWLSQQIREAKMDRDAKAQPAIATRDAAENKSAARSPAELAQREVSRASGEDQRVTQQSAAKSATPAQ